MTIMVKGNSSCNGNRDPNNCHGKKNTTMSIIVKGNICHVNRDANNCHGKKDLITIMVIKT